ncbi:MAG: transcriptional repressor [Rubritepida sp.]|nr:transcriptional repressor [Rubritepida sp.]
MADIDTQLTDAATRCAAQGGQLTELRRQVLELVLRAEQPVGAYALLDQLRGSRASAAPPTIYRALDFLLEHGLVHRIERLNAFIGCAHAGHAHAHQFLICKGCGTTQELHDHATEAALAAAAIRHGFQPSRMTVETEGLCAGCVAG